MFQLYAIRQPTHPLSRCLIFRVEYYAVQTEGEFVNCRSSGGEAELSGWAAEEFLEQVKWKKCTLEETGQLLEEILVRRRYFDHIRLVTESYDHARNSRIAPKVP